MNKEFKVENGIAKVYYNSQEQCIADNSKETRNFLCSTPCKKAKVNGEFIILRRSKRGMKYVLVWCSEYDIQFESGDANSMENLSKIQIRESFNPELAELEDEIYNINNRIDVSIRQLKKIYKMGISRARNIEYINKPDMSKFYKDILPDFLRTNSCRTKVFITPNLRSKMGV